MSYAGYALCSVESAYHTYIFLVKPSKLVLLCKPLPPIKVNFAICAVLLRFNYLR